MAKGTFPGGEEQVGGEVVGDGPPIGEALIERAEEDEEEMSVEALEARIEALEKQLESAHEALDASERRALIDRALVEADAVDLEAARLLTEAAVSGMDEPDVSLAVEELREKKPYLFTRAAPERTRSSGLTMRPAGSGRGGEGESLTELAQEARASGDRRVLLRYLRQRRGC